MLQLFISAFLLLGLGIRGTAFKPLGPGTIPYGYRLIGRFVFHRIASPFIAWNKKDKRGALMRHSHFLGSAKFSWVEGNWATDNC